MAADETRLRELLERVGMLIFFNQRAGREFWNDKPRDVQDTDIRNAEATLETVAALIRELLGHTVTEGIKN